MFPLDMTDSHTIVLLVVRYLVPGVDHTVVRLVASIAPIRVGVLHSPGFVYDGAFL